MLKINVLKFMVPIPREPAKDTLLLLPVTSLEGKRSDSEMSGFVAVKEAGISSLTATPRWEVD